MSILPEIILQKVIVEGIKSARENDFTLDMLLRNLPPKSVQELKKIIRQTPIDITFNYPREDVQLPSISILLKGEDESEAFLGDLIGSGYGPGIINPTAPAESEARGSADSRIRPEFFYTPTADTSPIIGEPRKMLVDTGEHKERRGVGFDVSYVIQIMTTHQEFTLFLYILIKFILILNRMTLERNGIINMVLSGTDFVPQRAQYPDIVYSRGLSCRFLNYFDFFLPYIPGDDLDGVAKAFDIDLCWTGEDSIEYNIDVLPQSPVLQKITPTSTSVGVEFILIAEGLNIQNGAALRFNQLPFASGPVGLEILETDYIDGNRLRVKIFPHTFGVTDVTVVNPDSLESTLTTVLTIIP